jgi:type IV secretory pathway VirB10-like protein
MRGVIFAVLLAWACIGAAQAQDATPAPTAASGSTPDPVLAHRPAAATSISPKIDVITLTVPKGTPMQVALDEETRIRRVGQPIHGHIVEPVYAFDRLVVPVGTEAAGQITKIEPVSKGKRTLEALNADFTPPRQIDVEFTELVFANGKRVPIRTLITPGSGQVIRLVTTADETKRGVKDAASEKAKQAKEQAKQDWNTAMQQVKEPGKVRKVERYAIAQLPAHPQYIDAGTVYFAELQDPLDFGSEPLTPEMAISLGSPTPAGSFLRARLMTPVNSATTQKGDLVAAVVSRPLFNEKNLIIPQGSRLQGSVVQVRPARYLSRNGQLRIVFHELIPPDGPGGVAMAQRVDASVESVQSGKAENVKLDSEGGAKAITPKTRYLTTGVAIGLAALSFGRDPDAVGGDAAGNTSNRVAGGAGGFKLVGIVLGILVHSRPFGYSMGAYGAGMSVYTRFIARGRDIVFPKNTAIEIAIGMRQSSLSPSPSKGGPANLEN